MSGVLVITVILALGILAITIFDKQTRAFIPASYRNGIVYVALAQMFGLYFYSKALKARRTGKPDVGRHRMPRLWLPLVEAYNIIGGNETPDQKVPIISN